MLYHLLFYCLLVVLLHPLTSNNIDVPGQLLAICLQFQTHLGTLQSLDKVQTNNLNTLLRGSYTVQAHMIISQRKSKLFELTQKTTHHLLYVQNCSMQRFETNKDGSKKQKTQILKETKEMQQFLDNLTIEINEFKIRQANNNIIHEL